MLRREESEKQEQDKKEPDDVSPGSVDSQKTEIDDQFDEKMDTDDSAETTAKEDGLDEEAAVDAGKVEGMVATPVLGNMESGSSTNMVEMQVRMP